MRSTYLCALCHRVFPDVCVFCGCNVTKENRSAVRGICGKCYERLYDPSLPLSNAATVELVKRHYSQNKGLKLMVEQLENENKKLKKTIWKLRKKLNEQR